MLRRRRDETGSQRRTWRPSLSLLTALGLLLGVAAGIFFGEYCEPLAVVGDAFIALLQMTVLPFIVVSLISNLGRLSRQQRRRLAGVAGLVLLVLWAIGLFHVAVLPQSFPRWKAGSFFSTAITESPPQVDFVQLFIPANIFRALAENHVPAVVLMSIAIGLAVASLDNRDQLIQPLDVLSRALIRINHFVALLTPAGVFAMAASVTGTLSLEEFGRLQAYLVVYTGGALLLIFVVLPWLITSCTPFTYRQVLGVSRDALITAFATGKLLVVLPLLIEKTEQLFARQRPEDPRQAAPAVDILYPLAYPFPHVGKLLGLLFLPFAAWFLGNAMKWDEYPAFLGSGLVSYFGGPLLATPYLINQLRLPHDMFQLFLVSGVYCARLSDAVGVLSLVAFTILTTCALTGQLRLRFWPLARFFVGTTVVGILLMVGMRYALTWTVPTMQNKEQIIARMQLLEDPVESVVLREPAPNPEPRRPGETLLQRIRRRGVLRVGYNEDKLPFAYFNVHGNLVGYDINLAHALARDLGVTIEFVRFDRAALLEQLRADHFDVVMSGLVGTLERSEQMGHTTPYMDVTLALVVPDYRVREFSSYDAMRRIDELRIGFVDLSSGFVERLQARLPNARLVELRTNGDFFETASQELDALLISAESGSAFTLLYPQFEVVVPEGQKTSLPLFYAYGPGDDEMDDFLEHWLRLRKDDGTEREYYDHWILGRSPHARQPRWSVIRDVLGWVE